MKEFGHAFEVARVKYKLPDSISISIHNYPLSFLPPSVQFDTIVSPANSYGRLDGAFDDAISRVFSPTDEYLALTDVAQKKFYDQWRGFAPPGTCTMINIPDEFHSRSKNVWGTKRVALCPTMRVPQDTRWDREVVYECIWSLLCTVDNHNRDVREGKAAEGETEVTSLLMTPLATGCGRVSAERWAAQAVLAFKHFVDASENRDEWSSLDWKAIGDYSVEAQMTWEM